MPKPGGFVYAISAVGTPLVKIGWASTSVEKRRKVLQTGQPFPLEILGAIPVKAYGERIEHRIHTFLAAEHRRGEWFDTSMDMITLEVLVIRAVEYIAAEEAAKALREEEPEGLRRRTPMTLGERILIQRRQKGLTQGALAEAVSVNKMTIWRVENDDIADLKGRIIARLAQALGVTTDYLLGLSEKEAACQCPPPLP